MQKVKITLLLWLVLLCACNSTTSDVSDGNIADTQGLHYTHSNIYPIEKLPATIYYATAYPYESKEKYPYTYMINKYIDIALDYMGSWSLETIKLDLTAKRQLFHTVSKDILKPDKEDTDLEGNIDDIFFSELYYQMVEELNSFSIIKKYLSISDINAIMDETDVILPFEGGFAYSKFEILYCFEEGVSLEHEKYNTTEYSDEISDCDCKYNYATSIQNNESQYILRYNLHSKWRTDIRYRNYKNSCPDKNAMRAAMDEWEKAANNAIKFVEIKDNGWNRFSWGIGCNYHVCISGNMILKDASGESSCGAVPWAYLHLSSSNSSYYYGTCLHELGHILGLKHEQTRPDRDCYINVNFRDIPVSWKYQYRKYTNMEATPYGDFDFNSIMLYGSELWINNCPIVAMTKKDGSLFTGQRTKLSEGDKKHIQSIYY